MKSFGMRLTAGVVTILFGAYAAALAQKDKQNDSESWSVQAPTLGESAEPISVTDQDSGADSSLGVLARQTFTDPAIALVQHTEQAPSPAPAPADGTAEAPADFNLAGLPASLGEPATAAPPTDASTFASDESMPMDLPDWAAEAPMGESEAMNMPAQQGQQAGQPAAEQEIQYTGDSLPDPVPFAEPTLSTTFASEAPAGDDSMRQPGPEAMEMPATEIPATGIPAMALAEPPAMDFEMPAEPGPNQNPANQNPGNQNPGNQLRGTQPETNALRSSGPGEMGPSMPGEIAQSPSQSAPQGGMASENLPPNITSQGYQQLSPSQPQEPHLQAMQAQAMQTQPVQQQMAQPNMGDFASPQPMAQPTYGNQPYADQPYAQQPPPTEFAPNPPPQRSASLAGPGQLPPAIDIDPESLPNIPGERRLEGVQSPSIVIQKLAPAEVKVGKPAEFKIQVQNVGSAEALDVRIHDRIPLGMRLVDAAPQPIQNGNLLSWQLGSMQAGQERTVTIKLVPEEEGELGSVARVTFEAAASVRTISTRPELKIVQQAPETVLIGQQLEIELEVSNPGSGDALGVSLQEDVPQGLEHPRGRQLDNTIGRLAAGEVRRQVLRLRAVEPGRIQNTIRLVSDDGLTAEHTIEVEVIAPKLSVELEGPSRRFLERQATYQLHVANPGTADATNLEIAVGLDRGFNFVSTDYHGVYDPSKHAVLWSVEALPAGGNASVPLTLLPIKTGELALTVDARADLGAVVKNERTVSVEGFSELTFSIQNPGGPIELGALSNYEINVKNTGSMADSNVQLHVQIPQGLELVSADDQNGQASANAQGQLSFQPRTQLQPGEQIQYRLQVRGVAAGMHLVKAMLVSDSSTQPVTKEESTRVYSDR